MDLSKNKKQKIDKKMIIGDIFEKYPKKANKVIEIMMDSGLHCVGCGAAMFETIEQGMIAHGYSDKEIDNLVKEINKIIKKE